MTLSNFLADSNMTWFRDHPRRQRPVHRAAIHEGRIDLWRSRRSGVFVAKDEKTGEWSEPAFFTMGAASFGFQFGAQMSEVVLLVLDATRGRFAAAGQFQTGGGWIGRRRSGRAGVSGATTPNLSADLLSFVRAKGLFAGVSLEGAALISRDEWSRAYYGKAVSPPTSSSAACRGEEIRIRTCCARRLGRQSREVIPADPIATHQAKPRDFHRQLQGVQHLRPSLRLACQIGETGASFLHCAPGPPKANRPPCMRSGVLTRR